MGNTIDSCFEEWKSFCLKCNYDKAYDCFIKVLSVAPDFNLFWSKIESSYSMKGYYLIFFNRYMDTILDDLNSKLVTYNDLLNIDENILYELNNYVFILRKCLILSSKTKQWAIIYKLLGNIYCTINNYHEAYECYKSALYFSKTIGVKSQFHNLAKKYGANDKINDDKFEYCLINNIHFKTINKWQCTPLRIIKRLDGVEDFIEQKSNKPKFYSNGRIVNVEKLVIDYYNEHGYRAYHCEGGVINFLSTLLFRDINESYIGLKEKNYQHYVDLINDRVSEFNKSNYRDLILEYYNNNKVIDIEQTDGIMHYKKYENEYYGIDYVKLLGYDEWITIIELIGIEKCFNYVVEEICRDNWCQWPYSGAPDLLVHNYEDVFLAEVKSTDDKLSNNQIWQHRQLSKKLNIPIVIFMVNKNEQQINAIKKQYLIK